LDGLKIYLDAFSSSLAFYLAYVAISRKDYKGMVSNNLIANCPISSKDVSNARTIFGPDLASIRGKTVRRAPEPVVTDYVAVPRTLIEAQKMITLAADVFFVDSF
jgi:hypothetical protein